VVLLPAGAKIYPYAELKKKGPLIKDALAGHEFTIVFDEQNKAANVSTGTGEEIPHFTAFVADARAFYPHAQVFKAK
jgi:hypothetical protein